MNIYNLLKGEILQQDLLNYYNANISYKTLPEGIDGFIFSYDSIYNIIINNKLSYYKKKKIIIHELAHLELSQLNQKDSDLLYLKRNNYEDEADMYIKSIKKRLEEQI